MRMASELEKAQLAYEKQEADILRAYRTNPQGLLALFACRKAEVQSFSISFSLFVAFVLNVCWQIICVTALLTSVGDPTIYDMSIVGAYYLTSSMIVLLTSLFFVVRTNARNKRRRRQVELDEMILRKHRLLD